MGIIDHEVIIIGGGPAGSSAAMNLANYGFDVCLVEKKIFPRETLCGEFLSGEVFENFKVLGIDKQFLSLKPNFIKSFKFFFENGKSFSGHFDFKSFGIKRSVLDSFLLENAKIKGVKVIQPAEVKEIYREGEIFNLRIKEPDRTTALNTSILIAAYGKQNSLDIKLNRPFSRVKSGFNGIKYHVSKKYFNSIEKDEIRIYTGKNIYCGVNYVDDETVTLCFLFKRTETGYSYRQHLMDLAGSNNDFRKIINKEFFDSINYQKVYGTGNIFFGRRRKTENGIIMIGDAAGVISPFSGDGIGMAFDSAKLAAEILIGLKKKNENSKKASTLYEINWRKLFGKRILISKIIQEFLLKSSYKKLITPAMDLFNLFPSFSSFIVNKTRT
ncbi:MAG TPA: NAD(P)/FAD-dependent oxidoreductase [Ignavibacteriaceae bacterium]|nr:NAD(P)/FAD-dependent oxidoreductase [Ignavibacteriaceae bacterium]